MRWFNDLTEEDKNKVVSDEVFLVRREPMGTKHFHEDPKSPEHKTNNIEEQTSVEAKELGEIGEDGNGVVDLQGNPAGYKHTSIDVQQKEHGNRKPKEAADECNNNSVPHNEPEIWKPEADEHNKDDVQQK